MSARCRTLTATELETLAFDMGAQIELSATHAYLTVGGITYRAELTGVAV